MIRLFVYGTLRPESGHPMARRLAHESRLIAAAVARGRLIDLGNYPALLPGTGRVRGDLLWLSRPRATLAWLDRYEGPEYARAAITVRCGGRPIRALGYRWAAQRRGRPIAGGDFLRRR